MESESGHAFCEHLDFAYAVALAATRDPAEAEEVVQDAFLRFAGSWKSFDRSRPVRPYLARTVAHAAADRARRERRRGVHESASAKERTEMMTSAPAVGKEESAALRAALSALDERMRLAVTLHYLQGLSVDETAEALEVPRSSAGDLVQKGVAELRRSLSGAGFTALALPAAFGSLPQPSAPAALKAAIGKLVSGAALGQSTGAAAVSAAAKGGIIVKIGLGVAAVGLVAGTTFWAVGGKSEEPAKPKAPSAVEGPASKFATPATDPGAEWEDKGIWAGCGYGHGRNGYLDGPRREAMFYTAPGGPGAIFGEDGATNIFRTYDPKTERFMTLVGSGARGGGIDGPFSRIRVGGWGYSSSGGMAGGGSSRYRYYTSTLAGKSTLRRFDFAKRVSELAPGSVEVTGCEIYVFEDGYFVRQNTGLRKYSHDGKLLKEYTLEPGPRESFGPYDPKNDRIYGSSREGNGPSKENSWVVWGWDLKAGGKFFGVIPSSHSPASQPLRKQMATGPFKGSFFYCPGGIGFGPGDPDRRYLYMGGGDEANTYRLDLEKQEWIKLVRTADGKRWRFGEAPGAVQSWDAGGGIKWAADGTEDMYPGYRGWNRLYERVK